MAEKDRLERYRAMRSADRTPEPVPEDAPESRPGNAFVIQEHHATALHWDFRLERDGVLVSWAIPKGLPPDPKKNHLAVHTEDHPLDYAAFEGKIPAGEYGGGNVSVWDHGTYELEKWTDREVKVVLHGKRSHGRYVLFKTGDGEGKRGRDWMIHRMDPPDPGWKPLPELVAPMLATLGTLPADDDGWAYEMKWDGVRLVLYVSGGRVRALTRSNRDVTGTYPELHALAASLGTRQLVLDGEIVAVDDTGRISFGALQPRMHVARPNRTLLNSVQVTYLAFDLLHLDGEPLVDRPYSERRQLLTGLKLSGPHWSTPPHFDGRGEDAVATSRAQGLEGVVAKRLTSKYLSGKRTRDWLKVKNIRTQEVVVGGWRPGAGRREGRIGSLLIGIPGSEGLDYVGHVGTGFTDAVLDDLTKRLRRTERKTSPFSSELPRPHAKDAHWVTPNLVGEVAFGEWTGEGMLRHPAWRGLRTDKKPADVVRED
ncbi:non-homologous end-joining DNA ligase [Cryptosporangium sp. NPDC051539]|uniref:non-homologous end-joining DNA ligase n=1 Tax=Cryptosporangium sp. NPDC051539 TaxID=3363962 RepID=UPI0037A2E7B8